MSLVTREAISAGAAAAHELACWDLLAGDPCPHAPDFGDWSHVMTKAVLEAAAPAIAAKALEDAEAAICQRVRSCPLLDREALMNAGASAMLKLARRVLKDRKADAMKGVRR